MLAILLGLTSPLAPPEGIRAFCIDFNWGPGGINGFAGPGVWADASPEEHVAWYAGLGADTIQTFAVSCNGYAWYQGGVVPPQPGLNHDFLTEVVRLGHVRGMKVMGYFCAGSNTRWGQQHPDLSYGVPSAPHLPFTDVYLDDLCASVADALKVTGMDGFMVDWVWNPTRPTVDGHERWIDAEKQLYGQLMGRAFPGEAALSAADRLAYARRAIDHCWERLHAAAKAANPRCIIWLSCSQPRHPEVVDSPMFRQVDWLMNENPNPDDLQAVAGMIGPQTKLVQCLVGWGDAHDAARVLGKRGQATFSAAGVYGFSRPGDNSLPLPVDEYRRRRAITFAGNDRNIAILARWFHGEPVTDPVITVEPGPDGRIVLTPETVNVDGSSPVVQDGQVGHWGRPADTVNWRFHVPAEREYTLRLTSAVMTGMAGSRLDVEVGGQRIEVTTLETGPTWRDYVTVELGRVKLPAGEQTLTIRPQAEPAWHSVSIKALELAE
ncbi:MAG: hypothetical protein HYU66_15975 [Armatimonadetes bacterium]|nr:hypothetical protein [Armatimonadota bacterium]